MSLQLTKRTPLSFLFNFLKIKVKVVGSVAIVEILSSEGELQGVRRSRSLTFGLATTPGARVAFERFRANGKRQK